MTMIPGWVRVQDELPPVIESFKNGMNYHGQVIGWFPYFYKSRDRKTTLWTCKNTKPRWMVSGGESYGKAKEPPTHWRLPIEPPEGMSA